MRNDYGPTLCVGCAGATPRRTRPGLDGPRARRARRGLRRHRHQPALRDPDRLRHRRRGGQVDPLGRLRRHLAGVLVHHHRRLGQVRRAHPAGRQRRRGRDHGAGGARPAHRPARWPAVRPGHDPRRDRCVAVLRRQRHHAGHLGDVGHRGPHRPCARAGPPRGPRRRHDHHGAVPRPALRHPHRRSLLRADHGAVVRRARRHGRGPDQPRPRHHPEPLPHVRRAVRRRPPVHRLRRHGCRRAVHHRRGGPVCRHGPLRARADPAGVVRPRLPHLDVELPGPGLAHPRAARRHRQPVLPHGAVLVPAPAGRPRHGRDRSSPPRR